MRLQQHRGLHPSLVDASKGSADCVRCHSEHNGENFAIVKWNPSSFDHNRTGFALDGKHAGLACNQCHKADKIASSERPLLQQVDLNRTFLGLSRTCATCHEDPHKGQLGANCAQCHTTSDWKAAQKGFDHSKTKFVLTGAHVEVGCQKCHTPGPTGQPRWEGIRFESCNACHADVHHGEFKQSCESCHNTATWKRTSFAGQFDHSKTKFPLLGKHLGLQCDTCHKGADFKVAIKHDLCADCHTPDPHNGQFAKRADGGKCESCHTVDGWQKTTFDVAQHNKTAFPLKLKHADVACAKCHLPAGKATLFQVKFAQCTDCHQDEHKGQFARAPYNNLCEKCHNEAGFRPALFTLAQHQKTRFVLTGGHVAVPCGDCHKGTNGERGASYHFASLECTTCHEDPHKGEFKARMERVNARGKAAGCEACHTTKAWNDLAGFDHDSTKFPLVGTHRAVGCIDCHRPPNMERKLLHANFQAAPTACEECHDDPHGGQFARGTGVTRCAECHNSMKWRPSLFDHEKTKFSLKGAHMNVRCTSCHVTKREVEGKPVLFYQNTPLACAACHNNPTQAGGS